MSQFNAPAYDIERPTGVCAFTGRAFDPGEPFMATLIELPEEQRQAMAEGKSAAAAALGFKRLDVSMDRWTAGDRPEHLFAYWKTVAPESNKKKRLFVDDDVLLNLLRRLEDAADEQRVAFRFVLRRPA
jgi:hypothetical protein